MANFAPPVSTYSDVTPQKRVITDAISLIDPSDAPSIVQLGGLDGASSKFRFVDTPGKLVEWLEDTLTPLTGVLDAAVADTNGTTITIVAADIQSFQVGHIVQIDSEQMYLSAVDTAGNTATVTRAFAGTTGATHADSATITIVGMARLEGAESSPIGFTDRYTGSNYTQILHKEVKVTRTQQMIAQYGINDEMAYQGDKVVPELMRLLARHGYYNTTKAAGSGTTPRVMGGFRAFVVTNASSGQTLSQTKFENAVKSAYSAGSNGPWLAFCSPTNLQIIKGFYDNSNFLRVDRTETTLGMVIESILTPYGTVNLAIDRWAKDTEILILDPAHVGWLTLYPFTQEMLAKSGDYDRSEVVGEYTLCVRQDKAHAILTSVSAS